MKYKILLFPAFTIVEQKLSCLASTCDNFHSSLLSKKTDPLRVEFKYKKIIRIFIFFIGTLKLFVIEVNAAK